MTLYELAVFSIFAVAYSIWLTPVPKIPVRHLMSAMNVVPEMDFTDKSSKLMSATVRPPQALIMNFCLLKYFLITDFRRPSFSTSALSTTMLVVGGAVSRAVWVSCWAVEPPLSEPVYGSGALINRIL